MAANEIDQTEVHSPEATQDESECEHNWLLAPPNGPVSKGVCRNCGGERDFPNHIEAEWGKTGRQRASATPTG